MTSPEFGAVAFVTPLPIFGGHHRQGALTCGVSVRNLVAFGDRLVTPPTTTESGIEKTTWGLPISSTQSASEITHQQH
jgi:hypothetical protein